MRGSLCLVSQDVGLDGQGGGEVYVLDRGCVLLLTLLFLFLSGSPPSLSRSPPPSPLPLALLLPFVSIPHSPPSPSHAVELIHSSCTYSPADPAALLAVLRHLRAGDGDDDRVRERPRVPGVANPGVQLGTGHPVVAGHWVSLPCAGACVFWCVRVMAD